MSSQRIAIIGPIGSFKIGQTQYNGVQLKDIVTKVATLPEDTSELIIDIAGPGGHKETGDMIYAYLESLKSRMKITTNQVGDIGSIDTKLFLVGDVRVALEGINPETLKPYEFFIHNPWNTGVSGDSAALKIASDQAKIEQEDLLSLYLNKTGLAKEAVQPLMDLQTGFDADEALALKFATSKRPALKTAAYMETKKKSVIDTLIALLTPEKKFVAIAPPAELIGKAFTVDGNLAPDGVYSVKGGRISALESLKEGTTSEQEAATDAATAAASTVPPVVPVVAAMSPEIKAALEELKTLKENKEAEEAAGKIAALVEAKVKAEIEAFKSTIKTGHRPPHKDVIIDYKNVRETPAQARNRENAERSRK